MTVDDILVTTTPKPSAGPVGWGVVLAGLGLVLLLAGGAVDIDGLVWGGVATSGVGLVLLGLGVFRLAQHVDRLGGVLYQPGGGPVVTTDDERARQAEARRARVIS